MQTKEIFTWLRLFIVSFVFIAIVWAGVQEYAKFYAGIQFDTPLERIALYASMLAVVIATAQWVLRPRPKTAQDYMREHMAETVPMPNYTQEAAEPGFEPTMPAPRSPARRAPAKKSKPKSKKGRR